MKKVEKVARIHSVLEERIPDVPVPLTHRDPYTLLVAVLLSAQTTDKKVNEVTPALFERGGDPASMAALEVDEIRELIKAIGLAPTKARNLRRLSEMLLEFHGGQVPESFDALEALPGVGHKTASVVMSQAFGHLPQFNQICISWKLANARLIRSLKYTRDTAAKEQKKNT